MPYRLPPGCPLPHPRRVCSVHPGYIDTPMVGGAIQRGGPERREAILKSQPMGQMGEPRDIAEGVLYLASEHQALMQHRFAASSAKDKITALVRSHSPSTTRG